MPPPHTHTHTTHTCTHCLIPPHTHTTNTNTRALYQQLLHLQSLVGLWRGTDDPPRGSLFHFRWAPDSLEVVQVVAADGAGRNRQQVRRH